MSFFTRFSVCFPVFLILSFTTTSLSAEALAFNDKRSVKLFTKDYGRYKSDFDEITPAEKTTLEGFIAKLDSYLGRVSAKGKEHEDVIACQDNLDALKSKLATAFGEGGSASKDPIVESAKDAMKKASDYLANTSAVTLSKSSAVLIELNEVFRQVKTAHQTTRDPQTKETYEDLRDSLSETVTAVQKSIKDEEQNERVKAAAPAATVETSPAGASTDTVSKVPSGLSDSDIARQYQKDYNEAYNLMRSTKGKDYLDETVVANLRAKIDVLKKHVDSISNQSQPFYGPMKANYESLNSNLDKAVANVKKQAQENAAKELTVADANAAGIASKSSSGTSSEDGAVPKELSYSAKRAVEFFKKELARMLNFDEIDPVRYHDYQFQINKLERYLAPIGQAEKGHPEVASCFQQIDSFKAKLAAACPNGPVAAAKAPSKPLSGTDLDRVEQFDADYVASKAMFDGADPKDQLKIRTMLQKLAKHLDYISFHGRKHEEVEKRASLVKEITASVDAAFGEVRPFTKEEEKLFSTFRAQYNSAKYAVTSNLDPISLQDSAKREKVRDALYKASEPLEKIANKNHPDYLKEWAAVEELQKKYDDAIAKSDRMDDEAGDVDGQLALIQLQFQKETFDASLPENASYNDIESWARKLGNWQIAYNEAVKFFEHAKKYSIKARSDEFFQYTHWFQGNVNWEIKQALTKAERDFTSPIQGALNPPIGGSSSSDAKAVKYTLNLIDEGIHGVQCLMAYQRGLKGKEDPVLMENLRTMEENIGKVKGEAEDAINNRRMPKAASTSEELLAIAKIAVAEASEEWGIGEVKRMVINYDKQSKKEVRYNGVNFEVLDWDEFQVTIAEKDGDVFYKRTAMIKYYRVGGEAKWRVVNSNRWGIILEENIFK
jgi:hypothetical protein